MTVHISRRGIWRTWACPYHRYGGWLDRYGGSDAERP